MERRTPDFARVFGDNKLDETETAAVIELAFLMAHANGDASPDELESLRSLIKHLIPNANVGLHFEKFSDGFEGEPTIGVRIKGAASKLSRPIAKELAYKAVYAVAVYDLETNEEERDVEERVINALGLDEKRAHELGLETTHALLART